LAHDATQGIDLADQVSLCGSPDRRIARHVRNRVRRQRAHANVTSHPGGGKGGFDSRVSGAYDNHIKRHRHDGYFPMQKC
jgi:hypothetical protein